MELQVNCPIELKLKVELEAKVRGISVSEFVCQSLEASLTANKQPMDALYADNAVFEDSTTDVTANHDSYLYGDAS